MVCSQQKIQIKIGWSSLLIVATSNLLTKQHPKLTASLFYWPVNSFILFLSCNLNGQCICEPLSDPPVKTSSLFFLCNHQNLPTYRISSCNPPPHHCFLLSAAVPFFPAAAGIILFYFFEPAAFFLTFPFLLKAPLFTKRNAEIFLSKASNSPL